LVYQKVHETEEESKKETRRARRRRGEQERDEESKKETKRARRRRGEQDGDEESKEKKNKKNGVIKVYNNERDAYHDIAGANLTGTGAASSRLNFDSVDFTIVKATTVVGRPLSVEPHVSDAFDRYNGLVRTPLGLAAVWAKPTGFDGAIVVDQVHHTRVRKEEF